MKLNLIALSCVAAVASLSISGCSDTKLPEPGGGASANTTVRVKSPEIASTSSAGNGGAATEPSGGGDTSAEPIKEGFGTITGVIKFEGAVPGLPQVTPSKDTNVCMPFQSERLVVSEDGGVANVFVYLDRAPKGGAKIDEAAEQVFDQKACIFLPHSMVIGTGQTVKIRSQDPIAHNTHTKPKRNPEFNSTIPANDNVGVTTFVYKRSEKEPVRVVCDYHAWMEAWHLPLDHPYAAVSSETGTFRIENVPSGVHKFKIWHEGCGFLDSGFEIRVQADEETPVTVTYPAARYANGNGVKAKTIRIALGN